MNLGFALIIQHFQYEILIRIILITLCSQSDPDLNPMELTIVLSLIVGSLIAILATCELGEWLTGESMAVYGELCQCDWHLLPVKLRRCVVVIMLSSQQPVIVHGFGNVPCSREVFKKVHKLECFE